MKDKDLETLEEQISARKQTIKLANEKEIKELKKNY
jgi:hypothetical protein